MNQQNIIKLCRAFFGDKTNVHEKSRTGRTCVFSKLALIVYLLQLYLKKDLSGLNFQDNDENKI